MNPQARPVPPADPLDEMDQAFESDDEDHNTETTPLTRTVIEPSSTAAAAETSQAHPLGDVPAYDFERDYDYQTPGAFPAPPGNNHVHSVNAPIAPPAPRTDASSPRFGFLRRAMRSVLPTHYTRLPTSAENHGPARGSGMENDGVFANVMAKPSTGHTVRTENGEVYVMPEETQKEAPPSYDAAQADSVPPYWAATVHAPYSGSEEIIIEGLPVGTLFSFGWNFLISMSFQFVGFAVTYILHTTHAAKYGARAGLGVTLIQYGLFSRGSSDDIGAEGGEAVVGYQEDGDLPAPTASIIGRSLSILGRSPTPTRGMMNSNATMMPFDTGYFGASARDWLSFLLMTIGWFLLLSSILGFARVKKWERSLRAADEPSTLRTPEDYARDRAVRANLWTAFGVAAGDDEDDYYAEDERRIQETEANLSPEEIRLRQGLRDAGLI